ncbi:PARP10_14_15 [Mytilus edulis]|uniref:Poly [ADP-ribose] polymerase n=1 Tax=Mytilus edulis TaxID=6550 RepID=A0A8S3UVJ5_MYTED|nr:PARP10_14_15 [Mytilus edulis]
MGEKLVEYPAEISLKLEEAVRGRKQNAEFYDAHGEKYIVDFSTYEEYVDKDPTNCVKVIRKIKLTGAAFELPTSWANMDEKENIKVVLLQQNDPDYRKTEKSFKLGTGGKYRIVQIEKIQNRQLHQQYMAKKLNMENESSAHNTERTLWHGTAYNAIDSINTYGFNRSYCGKNGN